MRVQWAIPILASVLILGVIGLGEDAWAPTKIAPTEAEPGHPFTIIDTPDGRLVDGTIAVFQLGGSETTIDLRTHNPHKTAQGRLPDNIDSGDYQVSFRLPDGTEVDVGPFTVIGEPTGGEPNISPTEGPIGTPFTITDPQGRIQTGDVVIFTPEGGDPSTAGTPTIGVISSDGTTFSSTVPSVTSTGQFFVRVTPAGDQPGRFADLPFFVTSLPPATVVIHLQDSNNNPIPNAFCRASDASGGFIFQVGGFTDENGQVTLSWTNTFITSVILDCFQDNVNLVLIGLTCIDDAPRAVLITEGDDSCDFGPV